MSGLTRRTLLGTGTIAAFAHAVPGASIQARAAGTLTTVGLRSGQRVRPLGVEDTAPSLGWRIEGPDGVEQSAYRVLVASTPDRLSAGRADLWDSGRVSGNTCSGVAYGGTPLSSRQRCFWRVEAWDGAGKPSAVGETSWWEMGLLTPADWAGEWLAAESPEERADRLAGAIWVGGPASADNGPRDFRLAFKVPQTGSATLTIIADGLLELWLDGRPVGLPARDPNAFGGPPAMRLPLWLSPGDHALVARVRPAAGFFVKPAVALAAQLRLHGSGGSSRIGDGWEIATKPEQWMKAEPLARQANFPWPPTPARLFRRSLRLDRKPASARLYIAALGAYAASINGNPVTDSVLDGEPVDYRKRIPYRVYDVTELLQPGANALGIEVGDGWYASYQAPSGRYALGAAPRRILAQLELHHADGTTETIATDNQWRTATSPVRASELYDGEVHDAAFSAPGWDTADFSPAGWDQALPAPRPHAPLSASLAQPIRITRKLTPRSIRRIGPDRHIVDFGQNFAGRLRLKIAGRPGQEIVLRHAEILDLSGELDVRNLRAARAEDRFRLAAAGPVTLEPRFTYHGFRYAEVSGSARLTPAMVEGLVIGSDLPETGMFQIDRPLIQKLWSNALWSQRANFIGIPTDCPQRDERLGWSGDAAVFWDTAAFNMDVGAFTRSFTRTLRDDQAPNGAFPLWAPAVDVPGFGVPTATPGWADAGVVLPYTAFLHTGDRQIVDENWAAMSRYLEGILRTNPDGLWNNGRGADLGDWLSLDAKQPMDETTPKALIGTAILTRSLDQMAAMAKWTGKREDAQRWAAQAARSRAAFAQAFVEPSGKVGNGSHTSYVLALRLGLVPAALIPSAASLLAADIERRGTLLSTGFLGTPLALDALADTGHGELAMQLLERTEFPSWGYMIRKGATTIWERWNSDTGDVAMNSFNHYALGAIAGFLYRRIGGIEPIEPGFSRFKVAPLLLGNVRSASVTYESVRGRIAVNWSRQKDGVVFNFLIPGNAHAEVSVPGHRPNAVFGSGRHRIMLPSKLAPNPSQTATRTEAGLA